MVKRIFEWYRVVSITPADDVIRKRTASATELLEKLTAEEAEEGKEDEGKSVPGDVFIALAAGIAGGFAGWDANAPIVTLLVEGIREQQPAFPSDLEENALELRVMAAVLLGEFLTTVVGVDAPPDDKAVAAAAAVVSSLGVRLPASQRFLHQMLHELNAAAEAVLSSAAQAKRVRKSGLDTPLANVAAAADVPTFWKSLGPALRRIIRQLESQAAADREELDVLWWLLSERSDRIGKSLRDMTPADAAIVSGLEIAEKVILPPAGNAPHLVRRVARSTGAQNKLSLESLLSALHQDVRKALALDAPSDGPAANYPELFPLTSFARVNKDERRRRSLADISAPYERELSEWAVQAFNERVLSRLIQE